MKRTFLFWATSILLAISHPALADSLQVSINSNVVAGVSSPNDNFWGTYSTATPGSPYFPEIHSIATVTFSSISVSVPVEDYITSYTLEIIPSAATSLSGVLYAAAGLVPPNPGAPSIAPTFGPSGFSNAFVANALFDFFDYPNPVTVLGNELTTGDLPIIFEFSGDIVDAIDNPGMNWAGYIGGYGQVDLPYTLQINIDYSPVPVPEPQTFTFVISGIAGLAGVLRRSIRRGMH